MSTERIDELRTRQFALARRGGYDRAEVDAYLTSLAEWLETDEAKSALAQREIERVGERTGAILSAAQQSAEDTAAEAGGAAEAQRAEADAYASETRADADRQARHTISQADERLAASEREAVERTAGIDAEIATLVRKRDAIVANLEQLSAGLRAAIDGPGSEDLGMPKRSRTAAAFVEPPVADPVLGAPVDDDEALDAGEAETRIETVAEHPLVEPEPEPEPFGEGAPTRPYVSDFDTDDELLDDARPPEPLPSGRDPQRRSRSTSREDPTTDEQKLNELL